MKKTVLRSLFSGVKRGELSVIFWDGEEERYGEGEPKGKIVFNKPPAVSLKDPVLALGEAYMDGTIDFQSSLEDLIHIAELNKESLTGKRKSGKIAAAIKTINSTAVKLTQKKNIEHHYDLGNDFFSLWLDETMSYSCAYFKNPDDSLHQAQLQKIDHSLKKLRLQPGERLLDIGSGWGWLIIQAAREYGVHGVGITLSEEQFRATKERVREYGLEDKVTVMHMDYLDLDTDDGLYDKIVSIGMFEHVGKNNLGKYMEKIYQLLVPGGVSLLHTITGTRENPVNTWIAKYIFPGGYIPSLREIVWMLPDYDFHLLHVESLRLHYAMTLDRWYSNFSKNIDLVREKFDEQFVRMWSLYLQGCAASFRVSGLNIHQLLFSKGLNNNLPLTMDHVYQ